MYTKALCQGLRLVHEDQPTSAAHALVLPSQVLPPRARAQVVEPVRLQVLFIVLRKACAAAVELDHVSARVARSGMQQPAAGGTRGCPVGQGA